MACTSGDTIVREVDDTGTECATYILSEGKAKIKSRSDTPSSYSLDVLRVLKGAFLPSGYPNTVSSDYSRYQIFNVLQAFCSSLAGLIASRAVLEGHGVGDASASATDALLLTILQDAFSRLTTIFSAYFLGTSLFPEAKTYRLLADIFNDTAFVLDTLSPYFSHISLIGTISCRGLALCLSGGLRALCGFAAGGSKTAITMHFAQPDNSDVIGDIGDLNAKDGSKETVLALAGMLCGSALIPFVRGPMATYSALAILIAAHLLLNYFGVRGVVMRSLNRQRTSILWSAFRGQDTRQEKSSGEIMTPTQVAAEEHIFSSPAALLHPSTTNNRPTSGYCIMGTSLGLLTQSSSEYSYAPRLDAQSLKELLALHSDANYILWLGPRTLRHRPEIVAVLKEGHGSSDHLRAWLHAAELSYLLWKYAAPQNGEALLGAIRESKQTMEESLPTFLEGIKRAGWSLDAAGGGLLTGSPVTIRVEGDDLKTK